MLTDLPDFAGLFAKMDENEDPAGAYEAEINVYAELLREVGACVADSALTETKRKASLSDGETAAAHWFIVSTILSAPIASNMPRLQIPSNYNLLAASVEICPNQRNGQNDTPTALPAAAGLHDFAGLFAAFDENDDATGEYIVLLQNFLPCVEAHGLPAGMNEGELTDGELTRGPLAPLEHDPLAFLTVRRAQAGDPPQPTTHSHISLQDVTATWR